MAPKISLAGIGGASNATVDFAPDLLGVRQTVTYRNELRERLEFRFASELQDEAHEFIAPAKRDQVAPNGKTWYHAGNTPQGSRDPRSGAAYIRSRDQGIVDTSVIVRYTWCAAIPFDGLYKVQSEPFPVTQ